MSHATDNRGLIMYWAFNEGTGTRALESVSQVQDKIQYVFNQAEFTKPCPPRWRQGVIGKGLLFDGYSTYIAHSFDEGNQNTEPEYRSALSIGVWVAPRSYEWGDDGKLSAIVNRYNLDRKQGYLLGMFRHGSWSFQVGLEGGDWKELWSPDGHELPKNEWSYVNAVFDGNQGEIKLYLNGSEIASAAVPRGSRLAEAAGTDLLIGKNNHSSLLAEVFSLHMFSGIIDELKIYNRALSAEEVAASYRYVLDTFHEGIQPQLNYDEIKLDRTPLLLDRHRPQYHVSPPAHWMNEPHAPIYFDGQYHLFYQHNPQGPFFHQIHWGHWVSQDLVHWRDLPVALAPEKDQLAPDGIWSGSATYDADGLPVLFFTAGNDSASPNQSVALARSTYTLDGNPDLVQWVKHPEPLIVQKKGMGAFGDFRDPFVWKDDDGWYALVGSGIEGGAALAFASQDMLNWTYKGPFFKADIQKFSYLGPIWELPVLLPLGRDKQGVNKHLLLVSPVGKGADVEVFYWIGQLDKQNLSFIPDQEEPQLIDVGDFHFTGPSGMVDPKTGRNIVFTIAQGDRTSEMEYKSGWAHNGGLPLSVYLRDDGRLGIEPIQELQSLRGPKRLSLRDQSLAETNVQLRNVHGDMLEIQLELEPGSAKKFGIKVRCTPDGEEETLLYYDWNQTMLLVDRSKTTLHPGEKCGGVQGGKLELLGENLKLHIYLDRSMVEAYANGLKSLTTRVYPSRMDALGLEIWGDGEPFVKSLDIWDMQSIW
ncbi:MULTISPECIES: GH32 C-terminal domain-containing protein [Paenibacillus]|uniref:GH32 C-terminal domain-containing protein n=1 Tax=Paenibacillus TaxID=44249 RepID=UPI00030CD3E4|nr:MULTISPECIES: GH32 C-terminal domain-containing protein [Paenibacillus]KKD54843.1 glycoside hydrolase [Paenibacillus sp. ICGEB2008]MDU8671315.1 GH32 C-terminal domain-containing protein [Paenibacillus polymyxa]MDU8696225.1 GH32 C-terminal domain-containing protein [Paenibacillus polymyxa]MEE4579542.1 GH32 C-terminal domain-containing protein [Paenibacillus polymyxa]URJ69966.1 GH32 C-terminal domain-containing protein [Paenibacillus polymyxa]